MFVRFPVKSSILKPAIWLYCVPSTHMNPIVPPPHAVMPRPIATDTTKAIETRPILLNFMRFLNPRQWSAYDHLNCGQNCRDRIPPLIVEAVATLCHFGGRLPGQFHSHPLAGYHTWLQKRGPARSQAQ